MSDPTPEQREWARMQAIGRERGRPAKIAFAVGLLVALFGFAGVYTYVKTDAEAKFERVAQGEVVYERKAGLSTILVLLGAPLAAGAAAGLFLFHRMGGKIPVEYLRGLRGE